MISVTAFIGMELVAGAVLALWVAARYPGFGPKSLRSAMIVVEEDGERLGVLKVSRGSIDWKPGKAKRTWSLEWERFDQLMREYGTQLR